MHQPHVRVSRTVGMACCIAAITAIFAVKLAIETAATFCDWARRAAR